MSRARKAAEAIKKIDDAIRFDLPFVTLDTQNARALRDLYREKPHEPDSGEEE